MPRATDPWEKPIVPPPNKRVQLRRASCWRQRAPLTRHPLGGRHWFRRCSVVEQVLQTNPTRSQRNRMWLQNLPPWFQRLAHSILLLQLGFLMAHGFLVWIGRESLRDGTDLFASISAVGAGTYGIARFCGWLRYLKERSAPRDAA